MQNLFYLLSGLCDSKEGAVKKSLTDLIIISFKEFPELDDPIKEIFSETKDESKRIYLLAAFIENEYIRHGDPKITEEISNLSRKYPGDSYLSCYFSDLNCWIKLSLSLVDCYRVAKTLIDDYKKKGKTSKKAA